MRLLSRKIGETNILINAEFSQIILDRIYNKFTGLFDEIVDTFSE